MKSRLVIFFSIVITIMTFFGCQNSHSGDMKDQNIKRILFLHHSTGKTVWLGGNNFITKVKNKLGFQGAVEQWFKHYNKERGTSYIIKDKEFPGKEPYGWKNYPYDYYNIWVKHGNQEYYMKEPTLKTLAPENDLIILKHCFPVSKIVFEGMPDIDSECKMIENYKMQYQALGAEMLKYPDTRFLLWTPPALTKGTTNPEAANAATEFSKWVVNEWDKPGDNIFVWDFRQFETESSNYLLPQNAVGEKDPHLSHAFAKRIYPFFCQKIVDVLENS
jgi:hypothetical protein